MSTGIGVGISSVFSLKAGRLAPVFTCTTDYSLEFDGITEFGDVVGGGPILGTGGTGSFTISVWLKIPTLGNYYVLDSAGAAPTPPQGIWSYRAQADGATIFRSGGGTGAPGNINIETPKMNANQWHLVSIVVDEDNSTGLGYLDGVSGPAVNLGSRDVEFISNTLCSLGRSAFGGYFNGLMCHLAIWNKALTEPQILELYNNTASKCYASDFSFSGNLQNYYSMFNPSGAFASPLIDTVGGKNIKLLNMSATNVSTDHPPQL
tara:strand:+ start:582 stop:1370 length:789 start_codon:yes stop_codon:yes gene_type:complete